jgi:adenylate cyclase
MAIEIERRFLVARPDWRQHAVATKRIAQAYLSVTPEAAIRLRIVDGGAAWLTIKSGNAGIARAEFEYPIPAADAEEMMALRTGIVIEKRRHIVDIGGDRWEVDVFEGELSGLVIAEIELDDAGRDFQRPDWLGREVTDDGRYSNAALATLGLPEGYKDVG